MSLVNYWRTRGLLILGAAGCWGVGTAVTKYHLVPSLGEHQASLLLQPSPVISIAVVIAAVLVGSLIGIVVAGRVRPGAGVFCPAFVLIAISWHSGSIRDVLFVAPVPGTYLRLAAECALLAGVLGACQLLVSFATRAGLLAPDQARDGIDAPHASIGESALATLLTAAAYVLLCWFLLPTDLKTQAIVGCAVAGFVAAAAVHHLILPNVPGTPFWAGVMLGAVVTFAFASTTPGIPAIGAPEVPPTRALPIDHAGAGLAAAVLGYWYSRRWKRVEEGESVPSEA